MNILLQLANTAHSRQVENKTMKSMDKPVGVFKEWIQKSITEEDLTGYNRQNVFVDTKFVSGFSIDASKLEGLDISKFDDIRDIAQHVNNM